MWGTIQQTFKKAGSLKEIFPISGFIQVDELSVFCYIFIILIATINRAKTKPKKELNAKEDPSDILCDSFAAQ